MTGPPDDRMSELHQLFFETATEQVQKLNEDAMQLEKSPADAENARSLRRTVHTLKGDSAACGFRELSELCHEFEDVLTVETSAAPALVAEIALRAADVFAALLEAYRQGTKLPDIDSLRADIARLSHPAAPSAPLPPPKKRRKPAAKKMPWSEYEQLAIARAIAEGKRVHHVVVGIDPQCSMPIAGRQMIQLALSELGEVLALYPAEGSHEPMQRVEAALASPTSAEQVRTKCNIPTIALTVKVTPARASAPAQPLPDPATASSGPSTDDKTEAALTPADQTAAHAAANLPAHPTPPTPAGPATQGAPQSPPIEPPAAMSTGPDNLLRVDAEKIDNVLNLVGELILAKSMLQQQVLEFGERFPHDALRGKFSDAMAFQARVLNDLQHSVMKIRMVPVEQLFRRFPRIARDVGRQSGKEVELTVRGGHTDLDKSILDAVAEPLTHLVRNAIGHGIEKPEDRVRAGKPAQGMLRLGAYHQGNQVVIEVSDDGAGIDPDKVRQRALAQGMLQPEQAARLSLADTLNLILQPGFSTAEAVTELSGRGVGLDVVQTVLARLKGTVQIETVLGRGTTFRMRLPLTLAIIRALMFRVEQRLYALPLNAVAEITRTVEENIHQVEHYDVLQLRNDVLPLLRLGAAPPPGPESARRKIFVLVIHNGERKFGVVVDALEGEGELVIKALDDHSITTDLVSGASILGDGRVVLILNMIALMDRFTSGQPDALGSRVSGLLSGIAPVQAAGASVPAQAAGAAGSQS